MCVLSLNSHDQLYEYNDSTLNYSVGWCLHLDGVGDSKLSCEYTGLEYITTVFLNV